jgi:hypothetical protein
MKQFLAISIAFYVDDRIAGALTEGENRALPNELLGIFLEQKELVRA